MTEHAPDVEATRLPSPTSNAKPPEDYDTWDEYMADIEEDGRRQFAYLHDEEYRQGFKALRLAPTLEVYRALISGQDVPVDALNQTWRRRYGL